MSVIVPATRFLAAQRTFHLAPCAGCGVPSSLFTSVEVEHFILSASVDDVSRRVEQFFRFEHR
jgi:hypothetical protein